MLDTDVVVAALRSDQGASRQLLLAVLNKHFDLMLSVPLILASMRLCLRILNIWLLAV